MRLKALFIALAAMLAQPAFAAGYGDFIGNWRNENAATSDITRLKIRAERGGLFVRAWGQCHPVDCDWGAVSSVEYSYSPAANPATSATDIVLIFTTSFARKIMILTDRPGDRLSYTIYTNYTDRSGRKPFVTRGTLRKRNRGWPDWFEVPGGRDGRDDYEGRDGRDDRDGRDGRDGRDDRDGRDGRDDRDGSGDRLSFAEDCLSFGWRNVEARRERGSWRVVDGSNWILNFGPRREGAERAAEVIRNYRLDKLCFIGRPDPSMVYWKSGDSIPRGRMDGDDCVSNNPDTTEARLAGGQWSVVDGRHAMLSFGTNRNEAQQAEEVIKHYGLSKQCFIGRPDAAMNYWLVN
jgi:hypothetical protein